MLFFALFNKIVLRHFRYEWGKLLLSVVGVAIGIATFVAIRLANTTAYHAFTSSIDAVSGRANLQIISNSGLGFDERLIERVRKSPAVQAAAPVVEQYAQLVDSAELATPGSGLPILVFGIDVFSEGKFRDYTFVAAHDTADAGLGEAGLRFLLEPGAAIITRKLADQNHLAVGDTLRLIAAGKRVALHVAAIIKPEGTASALGGNFLLLDIASAQETFGRVGRLDRVDLLVPEGERVGVKGYLSEELPSDVTVTEPATRGAQTSKMLDAFDLNLTALAFIALFVSMFIIYNTLLTNALRRRRELGILRAVGGTRGGIILLFLAEAALIGIVGVAVGLPLGVILARLAVHQVIRTVSALYILTAADHLVVDSTTLLVGAVIGVAASILSALPAAIEAARAHPRETFSLQTAEAKVSLNYRRIVASSILFLALAGFSAWMGERLMSPLLGFLSAGFLLLGVALLTPIVVRLGDRMAGPLVRRIFGVEGGLANAYLLQSLGRTSTAIAALMTAIAMVIGISTMVGSFRRTVEYWLRQTITADLYLTISSNRLAASNQAPMPREIVSFVDAHPAIAFVDGMKRIRLGYAGRTIEVSGARLNLPEGLATLTFRNGEWREILRRLDAGDIAVSDGFSLRFRKDVGDTIQIATSSGNRPFRIAGIYYDYTSDAGTIMMRHAIFARVFADSSINNLALYLREPSRLPEIREEIERRFGGRYSLSVYSNRGVREEALTVFDQTFAITYALQLVAVVVAAIGVANTLAALVVERTREIGILKAIGATADQVRKMTLVQAGLIGFASEALGIVAGLLLSAILIYVINRVSFGWTIQFTLEPDVLITSAVLVVVTALVAGLPPANAAARRSVAETMKRTDN